MKITKTEVIHIRVTLGMKGLLKSLARKRKLKTSQFLLESLEKAIPELRFKKRKINKIN